MSTACHRVNNWTICRAAPQKVCKFSTGSFITKDQGASTGTPARICRTASKGSHKVSYSIDLSTGRERETMENAFLKKASPLTLLMLRSERRRFAACYPTYAAVPHTPSLLLVKRPSKKVPYNYSRTASALPFAMSECTCMLDRHGASPALLPPVSTSPLLHLIHHSPPPAVDHFPIASVFVSYVLCLG